MSRAGYAAVVGQTPANLETPPPLPGLPADFEEALDVGLAENPSLIAAEYQLRGGRGPRGLRTRPVPALRQPERQLRRVQPPE